MRRGLTSCSSAPRATDIPQKCLVLGRGQSIESPKLKRRRVVGQSKLVDWNDPRRVVGQSKLVDWNDPRSV